MPKQRTKTTKLTASADAIPTRTALVHRYGASLTSVVNWIAKPSFPPGPPWSRLAVDQFLEGIKSPYAPSRAAARQIKQQAVDGNGAEPTDGESASAYRRKLVAEARCKEADARKKELQYRQMQGQLVERSAAIGIMRKIIIMVKNRVENLPDAMAMILPPEIRGQALADLRESVRMILVEMASMALDADETVEG